MKEEHVILVVAFAGLVAVLIGNFAKALPVYNATPQSNLTYNQPWWAAAPFTANVLPSGIVSQLGVPLQAPIWSAGSY